MKIGITGGIGSGKSYVCRQLERHGISVYDCDAAAKRLIRTSPTLQQQIVALVGSLDKAAMSRFLLASESNQQAMNAIIHPAVFRDFEQSGRLWMESAILFESGICQLVDYVVVVTAPDEVRIRRVMQRDGIDRDKVLQWMQRQWPQEEIRRHADFEIVNDGKTDIDAQIDKLFEIINQLGYQAIQ
jgi:dephospho-CoA kinase